MKNKCDHTSIGPVWLRIEAPCRYCKNKIDMECIIKRKGRSYLRVFYWKKSDIKNRTKAHPANNKNFYEISPGIWLELK